jgi:hypothetical protein
MTIAAMLTSIQAILQAAAPEATVVQGVPRAWQDTTLLYVYHDGHTDAAKAGPSVIRRTHVFPIHALVASGGDDAATEAALADLDTRVSNAFYTNRRLKDQTGTIQAATSQLYQRDGRQTSPAQYVIYNGIEFRHRWWTLEAAEDVTFLFA